MDTFMEMFRHHPDPAFLADKSGKIIGWNAPADEMLGLPYSPENVDLVANKGVHRFHPSLNELFAQCIQRGAGSEQWVLPLPGDMGKPHIRFIVTPIQKNTGVSGAWAVCPRSHEDRDGVCFTPENPVVRMLSFLTNMIESTVNGIVVMDPRGKVLMFNKSMEIMTGFASEDVVGIPGGVDLFYGWETAKRNMKLMRSKQYGRPGILNMVKTELKDRDGNPFPVTLSAGIMFEDGQETGSVGIFGDLRESERLARELRSAQERLIQADRNAALGRLSASVAHEINNPLSGILMFAEIMQRSLKDDPVYRDDLKEIIDQTLRCKAIVRNLLGFSRKSDNGNEPFDIPEAFRQCLDIVLPQAKFQGIEVKCDFQPDMPKMQADRVQMQQVFTNLVLNAADALEGKGLICIKARHDFESGYFFMEFRDNGPGVAQGELEKIFESFYTTKPVGYGTGLGLSITQDIIHNHGGTIGVENHPEGGTIFTIRLPGPKIKKES
ncbi:PAS domain-containing sensor histidine kinase [Desulfatibacillum aliphaticivorans]|uniref:PAS domain-containing sensor histidine kinase n=1 Tax=Desulfatibacillum aliphaticivorans TaxID=218208 RepID=UPI000485F766|nr:PAS domain-containing sensor histidine kinase [Desulfatibacillum aliphaticivorans]